MSESRDLSDLPTGVSASCRDYVDGLGAVTVAAIGHKRLVQDAKLQLAVDITHNHDRLPFHEYVLRAATAITDSRAAYARASARAMEVNADRPRWFNIHPELFGKPK